ncbi:MAG TPA: hypothetical protein DIW31_04640 [Bacteroidales bacterium]|nr:hypothetical protein [Bacteroidales bacterium]
MKIYIVTLTSIFLTYFSFGQTLPNPTGGNNALTNLTSDFGPRYVNGTTTKFHKGLDYSPPGLYGPAYAVENGTIVLPAYNGDDISYVEVGNFRYRHVHVGTFEDENHNVIWDYRINNNPNYRLLIIREVRNNVLTTTNAYISGNYDDGDGDPNNNNTFYDDVTRSRVTLRQTANQGDLIFRARAYPSGPHLHLERNNLSENPLSFLNRTNNYAPTINLQLKYNNNSIATEFGNDISFGTIIVETEENTVLSHDFDNLQLQISKNGQSVKTFSYNYTGLEQMFYTNNSLGISNVPEHNIIYSLTSEQEIRNAVGVGIYPIVPNVHSHDFFKYHFNSQATSTTSTIARGFQYGDGSYTFQAIGTDVGNAVIQALSSTATVNTTLDNLCPYLQKVEIKSGTTDVYKGEWVWNSTSNALEYIANGNANLHNPLDGKIAKAARDKSLTIKVTASEPLTALNIESIKPNQGQATLTLTCPFAGTKIDTEGKEWEFTIDASAIKTDGSTDGVHFIRFNGTDLAGNAIENFSSSKTSYSESEIPKRTGQNTWSTPPHNSQGYDDMHCFEIGGEASTSNSFSVTINSSKTQVNVDEEVTFTSIILDPNIIPEDYSYHWIFFEDKSPTPVKEYTGSNKSYSTSFSYPAVISAEVTLEKNNVKEGYGKTQNIVTVGNELLAEIAIDKVKAEKNESIEVSVKASGGDGAYSYDWYFLNGCSMNYSSNKTETISYSEIGTKIIQLTVRSGQTSKTIRKTVEIVDSPPLKIDFFVGTNNSRIFNLLPNRSVQFISVIQNAKGDVKYYWDFGDDTYPWDTRRTIACPSNEYTVEGFYTVTLRVQDDVSTAFARYDYRVSNLGDLNMDFIATTSPNDQNASFEITSNKNCSFYITYGDGTQSNIESALLPPFSNTIVTHKYSVGGKYKVSLYAYVIQFEQWKLVTQKEINVYKTPNAPNGEIVLYYNKWYYDDKFVLSGRVFNILPFPNVQSEFSLYSPGYYTYFDRSLYYRFKWWTNSPIEFTHPNEPMTWITLNDEIKDELNRTGTYKFTATLDVTGYIDFEPYWKTYSKTSEFILYNPLAIKNINYVYVDEIGNTVTVTPQITGGIQPYEIDWFIDDVFYSNNSTIDILVGDKMKNCKLIVRNASSFYRNDDYEVKKDFHVCPPIQVDAGNTIYLCNDGSKKTFNPIVSGGSGVYYYTWNPDTNLSSIIDENPTVSSTGVGTKQYTLTVRDNYGTSASDQVDVVTYDDIQINLDPFYYVNGTESSIITPTISGGSGNFSYKWSNGARTKDITINYLSNFEQTFTVKDNYTGCEKTANCKILCRGFSITAVNNFLKSKNPTTIKLQVTSAPTPGKITYSARSECDWLSVISGTSGYSDNYITFNVSENNTNVERMGRLIIESPEAVNSPYEIIITQRKDNIIRVPADFEKIQEAIDAASDGDRVEVDEGTYNENIVFSGSKKISVKATGCPVNTIISALNQDSGPNVPESCYNNPTVTFDNNNSVLQGFSISGHYNKALFKGGGIYSYFSNPELIDLLITDNRTEGGGGGINIYYGSPKITNVSILGNYAEYGGGLFILGGSVSLKNVLIIDNRALGARVDFNNLNDPNIVFNGKGVGILSSNANMMLDNVTISENRYVEIDAPGFAELTIDAETTNITNSIITGKIGTRNSAETTKLNINFSDITSSITGPIQINWGTGNKNVDPKFDWNFSLLANSPCIDTGDPTKLDKDGSRCDMGHTGGKGIFFSTAKICTKDNIFTLAPRFLEVGANCSPLLSYEAGESESFIATEQIALKNGFEGKTGSFLSFIIQPNYNEPFQYDNKCVFYKAPEVTDTTSNNNYIQKGLDFNVFPNPTDGSFKLLLINAVENGCRVEILNILGVTLLKDLIIGTSGDFNISRFKPGSYFIRITSGNSIKTKMIIKQ